MSDTEQQEAAPPTDEQRAAQVASMIEDVAAKAMKAPLPKCDFCGREQDKLKPGEGMVRSESSNAVICGACASGIAGCAGANTAAEARAAMAHSAMQAEAVVQCNAMMKLAGEEAAKAHEDTTGGGGHTTDRALRLSQAAELLGRIARGTP